VTWDGAPAVADRTLLGRDLARLAVFRLYWVNGRVTASEYTAKALLALSKLTGRGDDSAVIVVYAPHAHGQRGADEIVRRFLAEQSPAIEAMLAKARAAMAWIPVRWCCVVHRFAVGGLENGLVNHQPPAGGLGGTRSWPDRRRSRFGSDRRRDVELLASTRARHAIKYSPAFTS
jgi:hypothetical protein